MSRIAVAFVVSFLAAGVVQQAIMTAGHSAEALDALLPLAAMVLLVTVVFGIVAWWKATAVGAAAALLFAIMAAVGLGVFVIGVNSLSPGVGGNVVYLVALMVDFYFLLPCAVAVTIHWLILRGAARAG